MLDGKDFAFEGGDGRYSRELPPQWCFDGRAFGGYTSALALGAMFEATGREVAASLNIAFLDAGTVGPLEIEVTTLREGRSAAAALATITQGGRPILVGTAWLADGWIEPAETPAPAVAGGPGPDESDPLQWLTDEWAMLSFADRRNIDYPTSWAGFRRGRPEIALWVRVDSDKTEPLPHPQLGDVLHTDAHMFDAPGQMTGFAEAAMLSLDLNIAWQPGAHLLPSTTWRRFESHGSVAASGVTAIGSLRDESGALLASSTSQGLLRR